MNRRRIIIMVVVVLVLLCVFITWQFDQPIDEVTPMQQSEPTNTTIIEDESPTNTSAPSPTERVGVINCPECGEIALTLWVEIDNLGAGGGKVMHGDICIIIDQGSTDGVEKFKLNCDGKIGWLRAEGVLEQ